MKGASTAPVASPLGAAASARAIAARPPRAPAQLERVAELGEIEGLVDPPAARCEQTRARYLIADYLVASRPLAARQQVEVVEWLLDVPAGGDGLRVEVPPAANAQRAVVADQPADEIPRPWREREVVAGVAIQPRVGRPELLNRERASISGSRRTNAALGTSSPSSRRIQSPLHCAHSQARWRPGRLNSILNSRSARRRSRPASLHPRASRLR